MAHKNKTINANIRDYFVVTYETVSIAYVDGKPVNIKDIRKARLCREDDFSLNVTQFFNISDTYCMENKELNLRGTFSSATGAISK